MIQKGMLKRGDRVVWLPGLTYDRFLVGTVTDISEEYEFGSYPGRLTEVAQIKWDQEVFTLTSTSDISEADYNRLVKICKS